MGQECYFRIPAFAVEEIKFCADLEITEPAETLTAGVQEFQSIGQT